jgi:hypothetical protein
MTHLTDEQLNELLDEGTYVHTYTGTHVETCDECRARLEELRAVFTALESLPEIRPPRDLTQSILAQLPPAWGGLAIRPTRAQKWIFAAQSLAALGIFAWLATSFILPPEITNYQLPTLDSLLAPLLLFLSTLSFELPDSSFTPALAPGASVFHLSSFDLESTYLLLFIASAFLLGVVGNRLLLATSVRESRK